MAETVLFDTDKAAIKPTAVATLQQVVGSIGQRYGTRKIRVMGFADSLGEKSYNRKLSEQRAEAVKEYLVNTGKIAADRISVEPKGESQPVATNATPASRETGASSWWCEPASLSRRRWQ